MSLTATCIHEWQGPLFWTTASYKMACSFKQAPIRNCFCDKKRKHSRIKAWNSLSTFWRSTLLAIFLHVHNGVSTVTSTQMNLLRTSEAATFTWYPRTITPVFDGLLIYGPLLPTERAATSSENIWKQVLIQAYIQIGQVATDSFLIFYPFMYEI